MKKHLINARFRPGCRRRAAGCLLWLLLLFVAACALLFWLTRPANAVAAPLSVVLLIDNSASMFATDGSGSDPDQLRLDAARLFITYLGLDDSRLTHQCSVIFFGSHTDLRFPLTPLTDAAMRSNLLARLQDPSNMGWTDQLQALQEARRVLEQRPAAARPAIILLTDGKPEWRLNPTRDEQQTYAQALRAEGQALANAGIPLFIILLSPPAAAADPEIHAFWQPIWQQMAAAVPPGRLFQARQPDQLTPIYHAIVVALSGSAAAPTAISPANQPTYLTVPPNLTHLTLVINKSQPDVVISISPPGGSPLAPDQPGVRHVGIPTAAHQEIWVIDDPPPGTWTIHTHGPGQVAIWPAYRQHMATPTPSPALATATPLPPVAHPSPTATATPSPAVASPAAPLIVPTHSPTSNADDLHTQTPSPPTSYLPPPTSPASLSRVSPAPSRWLLPGLVLIILACASVWKYRRSHQPIVQGELHHLSGPGFASGQTYYELDALARRAITVGASPADLVLINAAARFTLLPGLQGRPLLIPGAETWLDDQPLLHERPLHDNALITLGATRLRYQNLRLRLNAEAAPSIISHTSHLSRRQNHDQ